MEIKNPPLKYYGAKWRLAPWIISHFPPHTHYIEICGGAGGVLLRKERSKLETYNDIWDSVVNFFRVLRDNSDGNAFIMAGVKQLCIIEAGESDLNDGRYFEDYEGFEVNEGFRLYNKRDFLAIT